MDGLGEDQQAMSKTWIKIGFLPMTGTAALDPKVQHKLGDGGAPAESTNRIEMLISNYSNLRDESTASGCNGGVLDLELPVACNSILQADEDTQVEEIVKKPSINKAGGLFRAGEQIANS